MPRLLHITLAAAALGVAIPVAIMLTNYYVDLMWWPHWIRIVWPTSFMLIATSAIVDAFFFKVAAISVGLNALLYAVVAALLVGLANWIAPLGRRGL